MSTKLCAPCQRAFSTIEPCRKNTGYWYSPFHETPWKVFEGTPEVSRDTMKTVAECDFCSFLIDFAASDMALGGFGYGCHSAFAPEGFRSPVKPVLCILNSPRWTHGAADLGLWRRKDKYHLSEHDISIFEAKDPRMKSHKPIDRASTNTSDQDSFDCLTNWIKNCSKNHPSCQKLHTRSSADRDWLPARLVKIISSADGVPETIQIIETSKEGHTSADIQYTTLSYCWGKSTFTKLLKSNYDTMTTSGLSVQDLPPTFRDAITATTRLGLEYIWIDALCIIQLDEEDWSVQSVTMARVYAYSTITLAAAASSDAHGGLFRDRDPTAINGLRVDIKWPDYGLEGEYHLVPSDPWARFSAKSPLMKRAWVFQERLLSRGTVYFAHDMLYWECGELYASELYPEGGPWGLQYRFKELFASDRLPSGILPSWDYRFKHVYTDILTRERSTDNTSTDEEMFLFVWASIVTQYSLGKLTETTDKLIAIDGVAEQMTSIVSREHYLSGIWRQETLPLFLLWSTGYLWQLPGAPPTTRIAPSWSWASVHNPVEFSFLFRAQNEPKIVTRVVDVIIPDDTKPGGVSMSPSTALIVHGPLTEVLFRGFSRSTLGPLHSLWWRFDTLKDRVECINPISFSEVLVFKGKGLNGEVGVRCLVTLDWKIPKNRQIFALKVAEADIKNVYEDTPSECGLLLMPCNEGQERGTFIRIGYFRINVNDIRRDWLNWATLFKPMSEVRNGLWSNSRIEEKFYREKDEKDGYTIKIV